MTLALFTKICLLRCERAENKSRARRPGTGWLPTTLYLDYRCAAHLRHCSTSLGATFRALPPTTPTSWTHPPQKTRPHSNAPVPTHLHQPQYPVPPHLSHHVQQFLQPPLSHLHPHHHSPPSQSTHQPTTSNTLIQSPQPSPSHNISLVSRTLLRENFC